MMHSGPPFGGGPEQGFEHALGSAHLNYSVPAAVAIAIARTMEVRS
jgi:hypothetical protein